MQIATTWQPAVNDRMEKQQLVLKVEEVNVYEACSLLLYN